MDLFTVAIIPLQITQTYPEEPTLLKLKLLIMMEFGAQSLTPLN